LKRHGAGAHRRRPARPLSPPGVAGRYRNPAAKKKAILAVAHTVLVIIWQLLATDTPYTDLGPDFYDRRTYAERETRRLIVKLDALGHTNHPGSADAAPGPFGVHGWGRVSR
jgi:hypothetical protein